MSNGADTGLASEWRWADSCLNGAPRISNEQRLPSCRAGSCGAGQCENRADTVFLPAHPRGPDVSDAAPVCHPALVPDGIITAPFGCNRCSRSQGKAKYFDYPQRQRVTAFAQDCRERTYPAAQDQFRCEAWLRSRCIRGVNQGLQ